MPITPDSKDWTWVIDTPCPQCRFDPAEITRPGIPQRIVDDASQWPEVLNRADARVRPGESIWSPLEYAAHVRDVFRIMDERLRLMVTQDDPEFANWDQDATAVAERYNEQDLTAVGLEILAAASAVARRFATAPDWTRTGRRGSGRGTDGRGTHGSGSRFTVFTLAVYLLHDVEHHLFDVGAR